jgi:hypothetical protein
MARTLGRIQEGIVSCKSTVRWLYRLDRSFAWDSGLPIVEDHVYRDKKGKVRLILEQGGRMIVTRGYAWNGCSPKVCLFDILIGTPDGAVHTSTGRPKAYFASLIHDALYQFLVLKPPVSRTQADRCFLKLLQESDFALAYVYWLAVRVAGRFVWQGKQLARKWHGQGVTLTGLVAGQQPSRLDAP